MVIKPAAAGRAAIGEHGLWTGAQFLQRWGGASMLNLLNLLNLLNRRIGDELGASNCEWVMPCNNHMHEPVIWCYMEYPQI